MKKIAVINDLSGLGKCSLTAAIPVISVMGVQACPFPTAILSNQTGYDSYFCDDYTDRMDNIMKEWEKREFAPDGIYTGFLASECQADKVMEFIGLFSKEHTLVLADPVMGDQGHAFEFCTDAFCEKMRLLVRRAHVATPNLSEALLLLVGKEGLKRSWKNLLEMEPERFLAAIEEVGWELCEKFSLNAAVITGIEHAGKDGAREIGNLVFENGHPAWVFSKKQGGSYSGTGDLFASVLCAGLVKGISMEVCAQKASSFLSGALRDTVSAGTDRNEGICFENHLWELI